MAIICNLLLLYLLCLFARAVLSWFPRPSSGALATVAEFLFSITEPVLAPVRRVIPPMGGLDLSFLAVTFGIIILQNLICH